jgi:CRISPR/Cas system-associated exonuclease Cas4 (RecB family)
MTNQEEDYGSETFRSEPPKKAAQLTIEDEPRGRAYVWTSWITKLLAGESKCWYAAWYKAHFKYLKRPDAADRADFFAEYNKTHDRIVGERVDALKAKEQEGGPWTVKVEEEGEFKIRGTGGDLSGKPDIVAMRGNVAVVVDAKSGKPRESDHWQVRLYALFIPMAWLKGFGEIRGEVEYRDHVEQVKLNPTRDREKIGAALRIVTGATAPKATPGADCKFCDIQRCAFRHEKAEGDAGGVI